MHHVIVNHIRTACCASLHESTKVWRKQFNVHQTMWRTTRRRKGGEMEGLNVDVRKIPFAKAPQWRARRLVEQSGPFQPERSKSPVAQVRPLVSWEPVLYQNPIASLFHQERRSSPSQPKPVSRPCVCRCPPFFAHCSPVSYLYRLNSSPHTKRKKHLSKSLVEQSSSNRNLQP